MKVLLLKDVFKLGRAGDVKRVADGYGRNYLLPQGLAVLATPGALKQVDRIVTTATVQRNALNEELGEIGGHKAARVLRGEDPCNIPVTTFTTINMYLNPGAAERMGATIPQSLLDKAFEIWTGEEWEEVGH